MDEKWKLGKKGSRKLASGSGIGNASMMRCGSVTGSTGGGGESSVLKRSESVPGRSKFSRKCASVVKEQRAKFYIVRRCVTMLVCWKDYRDS